MVRVGRDLQFEVNSLPSQTISFLPTRTPVMIWKTIRLACLFCGIAVLSITGKVFADTPSSEASPASEAVAVAAVDLGVKKPAESKVRQGTHEADGVEVEMFRAMADGQLEVEYIGKDATQASLFFRNKTDKPLKIKLPETFGAVHVLAQGMGGMGGGGMGGMGGGMGGMGGGMGGMGGGGQAMGGGMGGMGGGGMGGGGMGGGGMGGGMFRVESDKPRKMTVATLCLEHGKQDPNPRMKYKVVPIEVVSADPQVSELCKLLGNGRVAQNAAQAAAWHLANGLSWQELINKPRKISRYTGVDMFFSEMEMQAAIRMVAYVKSEVDEKVVASDSESISTDFSQSK